MNQEPQPAQKTHTTAALFIAILFLFLAGTLFFGKWLVYHRPAPDVVTYNGFVFNKTVDGWTTLWQYNKQVYEIGLRYNPQELENVSVDGTLNATLFNQQHVYLTFDPNLKENYKYEALTMAELGVNFKRGLGRTINISCTTNETEQEACKQVRPITCADIDKPVILVNAVGVPSISMMNNCILLQGQDMTILQAADKLLYMFYGIINTK